ncbi:MAG: TIGR02530 family flagellar biosynthesis protein [Bacillota bacterium]
MMLDRIAKNQQVATCGQVPAVKGRAREFEALLRKEVQQSAGVKLSAHAERRLRERNINLSAGDLSQLARAMEAAAAKGTRDVLLVFGNLSLIVSTVNRTVITAVAREEGHVFTNIDGAVVIK